MGDTIRLGRVLAHKADGEFKVGQPYLENVAVEAEILEELRGPKVGQGERSPFLAAASLLLRGRPAWWSTGVGAVGVIATAALTACETGRV